MIGRMRVDNGLLQYVRYQHGSLVDATRFVPAAHLGACGFRCKMASSKMPYLDKYWNLFYTQYFEPFATQIIGFSIFILVFVCHFMGKEDEVCCICFQTMTRTNVFVT